MILTDRVKSPQVGACLSTGIEHCSSPGCSSLLPCLQAYDLICLTGA